MKKYKNMIIVFIFLGLISWGFLDRGDREDKNENTSITKENTDVGLAIGNLAPDFEIEMLDGTLVRLSDFRGKTVFLNFWATWCPPCRAETPHMQDFYEKYNDKNVTFLAVNITTRERNIGAVNEFVDEFRVTFPVLLDKDGQIERMYQAYVTPTMYFINAEGIIQQKIIGPMSHERMESMLRNM